MTGGTRPDPEIIAALTAYAESEELAQDAMSAGGITLDGVDAAAAGRGALERASGGRPSLGESHAAGRGRSPKRQVRLTPEASERLDAFAREHDMTPSAVIRRALDVFLDRAG